MSSVRITELDIDRFTCGDCAYLARAIHLLTGWPMYSFRMDQEGFYRAIGEPMSHSFVVMPDGRILDVEGVHTEAAFRKRWHHWTAPIEPTPWEMVRKAWADCYGNGPTYGRYTYRRAHQVAAHLVEKYS